MELKEHGSRSIARIRSRSRCGGCEVQDTIEPEGTSPVGELVGLLQGGDVSADETQGLSDEFGFPGGSFDEVDDVATVRCGITDDDREDAVGVSFDHALALAGEGGVVADEGEVAAIVSGVVDSIVLGVVGVNRGVISSGGVGG